MVKKSNRHWDIKKNGYSKNDTLHNKPGNFNSLRLVIFILLWHCYLETDWRGESVPKKVLRLIFTPLDDRYEASLETLAPTDIVVEPRAKNWS